MITIYAPNDVKSRSTFFHGVDNLVTLRTLLVGDFNSVTCTKDRASGNLDSTSLILGVFFIKKQFYGARGYKNQDFLLSSSISVNEEEQN